VILGAVLGAASGLFMGYENGIAGGVASFPEFQAKFFPSLLQAHAGGDAYCKYDDQLLALFVSCVYLASSAGAIVGSFVTPRYGRRATIGVGAVCFLIGAALQGFAVHVSMLILGRIALGLGVGMNDQAGPQYLSEVAPYRLRAAFNCCFQLLVVIGILVAQLINYGTHTLGDLGWRLSLGLAAAPALVVLALSLVLDDTPNSLVERGHPEEGLRVLRKIRGTEGTRGGFGGSRSPFFEPNFHTPSLPPNSPPPLHHIYMIMNIIYTTTTTSTRRGRRVPGYHGRRQDGHRQPVAAALNQAPVPPAAHPQHLHLHLPDAHRHQRHRLLQVWQACGLPCAGGFHAPVGARYITPPTNLATETTTKTKQHAHL
jgi:MFS family permease